MMREIRVRHMPNTIHPRKPTKDNFYVTFRRGASRGAEMSGIHALVSMRRRNPTPSTAALSLMRLCKRIMCRAVLMHCQSCSQLFYAHLCSMSCLCTGRLSSAICAAVGACVLRSDETPDCLRRYVRVAKHVKSLPNPSDGLAGVGCAHNAHRWATSKVEEIA